MASPIKRARSVWFLGIASLPLILFLLLPCIGLIVRAAGYDLFALFLQKPVVDAIAISFETTLAATGLTILFGTPVAYLLARKSFRGKGLLEGFIDLPMVMPPAVAGLALLILLGRRGILGSYLSQLGVQIAFTPCAVVLAQLFVASPFFVKSAAAGFIGVDRELEQSAAIDGASPWKVFRTVTVPLASPSLIGGAILTWARALGEFGATIMFAGNFPGKTQTMPLAIYLGFEMDFSIAVTLSIILLAISFLVLFLVKGILRRRFAIP